jgi:hypothetical protein
MQTRWTLIFIGLWILNSALAELCVVPHLDLQTGAVARKQVDCRFGQCVHDKSFGQVVYKSAENPEVVRYTGSDYCLCTPGYFGIQCQYECPYKTCAERHVYPMHAVRHSEKCGQVFYEDGAFGDVRSLSVAGMCNCPPPLLGEACQFSLKSGDPLRYFQQDLLRSGGVLRPSEHVTPTLQNFQTSALPTICGKFGVFNTSDASCSCNPGWLSTAVLRSPDPPTTSSTSTVNSGEAASTWHMPASQPSPTWTFSHLPLCGIPHAKFTVLKMDSSTPSGVEDSLQKLQTFRAKNGQTDMDGAVVGMKGITIDECIGLLSSGTPLQKDDVEDCAMLAKLVLEAAPPFAADGTQRMVMMTPPSTGLSGAAIAGIVIGAIIAVLLLITTICLCAPRPRSCCSDSAIEVEQVDDVRYPEAATHDYDM